MSLRIISIVTAMAGMILFGTASAESADGVSGGAIAASPQRPAIVDWRSVESDDYLTYVGNLQSVGCPAQTIRSIVTTDVIAAFAGKRSAAAVARYQNFKYWQSNPPQTQARANLAAQRRMIDEEMNGVLQKLLGPGTDLPDVSRQWQQEEWNLELAFLAPEKREATMAILVEYSKVEQQMKELAGGLLLTEDTNELQQILARSKEEQTALHQVLRPEEYEQVEMTVTWTADNLRHALVHFEPTQEEFHAIFQAWRPHDDSLAAVYAARQPDPGHAAVYAKIKDQLSASRYDEYCATWWK